MRYLVYALVLIFLLLFSLPYVASTSFGTKTLCSILSSKSTRISIDDLSLGWFDMQMVQGVNIESKGYSLSVARATAHHSLFEVLFKGGDMGKTMILEPRLTLKSPKGRGGPLIMPYAGDVFIEKGFVTSGKITIEDINAQFGIPPNHSIVVVKAKGRTSDDGIHGYFDIDASVYPTLNETSSVLLKLKSLPTRVVDKVLELYNPHSGPLVSQAFGPILNANLSAKFGLSKFDADLHLNSKRMNGQLSAYYDQGGISVKSGSHLDWLIDPAILKLVKIPYEDDVLSKVTINKMHFPYEKGSVALKRLLANVVLTTDTFSMEATTKNLQKSISVVLSSKELDSKFKVLAPLDTPHIKRVVATANKFPLYLLNDYGDVTGVFGDTLTGELMYETGLYTLSLRTDLLSLDKAKLTYIKDTITLKNQAPFVYRNFKGTITNFQGTLQAFTAKLKDLSSGEAELKNVELSYKAPNFKMSADGHTGKLLFDTNLMTKKSNLELKNFSSYTLGLFVGGGSDFPSLIGPQLNLKLSHKDGNFDLNATSENLYIDGNAREISPGIYGGGPLECEWTLSDQSYHALARFLDKPSHEIIKIKRPAKLKIDIHEFQTPFPMKSIDNLKVKADLKLDDLYLEPDYRLTNLKGYIAREDSTKFFLKGEAKSKWHTGSFQFEGAQASSLRVTGALDNLPSIFLDILPIPYNLSAILGDRVSAKFESYLNDGAGNAHLDVNSPNCKAAVQASLRNGYLYLKKTTPKPPLPLPQLLVNFSLKTWALLSHQQPILSPFTSILVAFPCHTKTIAFETSRCPSLGSISDKSPFAITVTQKMFRKCLSLTLTKDSSIHLWFAPMDLSIREGLMHIDRTEVLYNKAQEVCYWGEIDLYREYVNMILGLTAQSLDSALGLALPNGYVLQVPLRGPYGDVKLQKEAAMSQIAMLIAGRVGSAIQGPWGNLLEAFGDAATNQSSVPPPKHPFPWEQRTSQAES